MWLVLCHVADEAGIWAYQSLRARGLGPIELVTAEAVACALRWEHRLGADTTTTRIRLADGRELDSTQVRGTLNRLAYIPADHLSLAEPADRDYAIQEFSALFVSWLSGLPGRTLNRPTPQFLAGPYLRSTEWNSLASRSGLSTYPVRLDDRRRDDAVSAFGGSSTMTRRGVIVIGNWVVADAPRSLAGPCIELASRCEATILGIEFVSDGAGDWIFTGATAVPDLRLGGNPLLDALAEELSRTDDPA